VIEPDTTQPESEASSTGCVQQVDRGSLFLDHIRLSARRRLFRRWWIHLLLLLATSVTTTVFGFALWQSFVAGEPVDADWILHAYQEFFHGSPQILRGMSFSLPLLAILLAHEIGHNVAAFRSNIDASLPYFLPFPSLFGTLGAFIRIRSPIYSRKSLFDVGFSGPIAGFAFLLPFLFAGLALSHTQTIGHAQGTFAFGTPLLLRWVEHFRFPGVPPSSISLHPLAMAAWVGLFSTAINLLPIGQLDGGHILYAAFGERGHRVVSNILIALLGVAGFFYAGWWLWACLLFIGRRHPLIYDSTPLGRNRLSLAFTALLLFILSASVVPVSIR
jgi:membrane-associated protease RseP (regulator of RpoE activity)